MTVESLTAITDAELLTYVKYALNISGNQFDNTLTGVIAEVKEYLKSAGVPHSADCDVVGSTLAVGCIARGVADLWNYGNGDTKLSEYFYQRAEQLRHIKVSDTPPVPPTPVYTEAKIIFDVTDSVTGATLTGCTISISGASPHEDGFYYFEAGDVTGLMSLSGYRLKRFNFTVTAEDVAAGEKTVPVELVQN